MDTVVDGPALRTLVLRMSQDQANGGREAVARLKRSASGSLDTQSPPSKEAALAASSAAGGATPSSNQSKLDAEGHIDAPKEHHQHQQPHHEDDECLEAAPLLNALSKSAHRLARKDSKHADDASFTSEPEDEDEDELDPDDESADPTPKRRRASTGKGRKKQEKPPKAPRTRASTGSSIQSASAAAAAAAAAVAAATAATGITPSAMTPDANGSKKPKSGKKGTFSQEEDNLIIELVKKHGSKWSLIKTFIGNGSKWTGAQIAQRYRRVLSPREKQIHPRIWSPMEEMRLLTNWSSVEMRRWSDAAKHVGTGRCDVSCQYWASKVSACQRAPWTKEEDEALVTAALSHSLHVQPIQPESAHFETGKQTRWEAFYTRVCLSLRHTRNSRTPYSLLVRWAELVPYIKNGKLEGVPEGQLPPPIPGASISLQQTPTNVIVSAPPPPAAASATTPLMNTVLSTAPIPPPPSIPQQATTAQLQQHLQSLQQPLQRPAEAANALNDLRSAIMTPATHDDMLNTPQPLI